MDKSIGFGLYQFSGNRGNVRCVFVFRLQWGRWGVGRRFGTWSGEVGDVISV